MHYVAHYSVVNSYSETIKCRIVPDTLGSVLSGGAILFLECPFYHLVFLQFLE